MMENIGRKNKYFDCIRLSKAQSTVSSENKVTVQAYTEVDIVKMSLAASTGDRCEIALRLREVGRMVWF